MTGQDSVRARQEAFAAAVDGSIEVPVYAVTEDPDGAFVVVVPAGTDAVGRAAVTGDVDRRFRLQAAGLVEDPFAGLRVPWTPGEP